MTRLTGHDAIDFAERTGAAINQYADPTGDAREGLTVDEARAVVAEDPSLIYVEIDEAVAMDAQRVADAVTADRDPSLSWHDAGYASALDAARVLVGDGETQDVREYAAILVAEIIAEDGQ